MLFMAVAVASCEDYNEPLINDIGAKRVFTPLGLTAKVTKLTTVVVNWTPRENTDHYVVDFSADDADFTNIVKTMNVTADQLPISVDLDVFTNYSIRLKAVSSIGKEDSKYAVVTAQTTGVDLFLKVINGDIKANTALLRWVPNTNATTITLNPGNIIHTITADEKFSGEAVLGGLAGEISYTANLMKGSKVIGMKTFKTEVDPSDGIIVPAGSDLKAIIAAAPVGAKLLVSPGEYTVGSITLNKPISLIGLYSYNKPKLHVNFFLEKGASDLKLQDLEINGDKGAYDLVKINGAAVAGTSFGDIQIIGCNVYDFGKALVNGGTTVASTKVNLVKVDNSIITGFTTAGATDFIDFRVMYVANISLTNSTFNNCASRDFIRADNTAGYWSGTGLNTDVVIDKCTIVKSVSSGRLLYVRFNTNSSKITNSMFADIAANYTNQSTTIAPSFGNNNYFNCPALTKPAAPVTGVKYDESATLTKLDPKFADALNGNFTVGTEALSDNKVGDPRWLK